MERSHVNPENTHKDMLRKCTLCAQTLIATNALQQSEARMMKWIWLINRSRSSITLCTSPFSNLPACIPFFFVSDDTLQTISTSPDSTIIIHSPSSTLHLSSVLLQHSLHLFYFPSLTHAHAHPPPPSGSWLKTHTQTDSGTERQPGSDLRSEL